MGMLRMVLLAALVVSASSAASAAGGSNQATVTVDGEGNGVAVCQVLVVVGSVLVLGVEDSLGLAALPAEESLWDALPRAPPSPAPARASPNGTALATCDVEIGLLRVVLPPGAGVASYVSGAEAVGADARSEGSAVRIVSTPGNAVAVCQRALLVSTLIVGGAAYGLPAGPVPGALEVRAAEGSGPGSRCASEIRAVEVLHHEKN